MRSLPLLVLTAASCSLAVSQPWRDTTSLSAWESITTACESNLLPGDFSTKMLKYNFGRMFLHNQSWRLGFIGKDYQKFDIRFLSIREDSTNPRLYRVRGKTRVKTNVCDFTGTLKMTGVKRFPGEKVHRDDGVQAKLQGVASFTYLFREDPHQKGSGSFTGEAATSWYTDSLGSLHYDDLWNAADSFINNTFVGTWTSYTTHATKPCNWGDGRIPNSGDLDVGTGEFYPKDKYQANGWENFRSDTTAWWK